MAASSVTRQILACADFRRWAWWQLPKALRCYVGAAVVTAVAMTAFAASETSWRLIDLGRYSLLLGCGIVSVAAKPGTAYRKGGMTRDFLSAWVLPVAILLPPVYAMVTPIPLQIFTQMRVHKGVVYRRVFTVAVIGQCYGAASLLFRQFPASFAGGGIGVGAHAVKWTLAVAICEIVGGRGHNLLIAAAVKISDPQVRLLDLELNREALAADFAEFDMGILMTVVVGVNSVLAIFAVPTVLLIRRFMMHAQLVAQSRLDTKTGLLNSATWEAEAEAEVTRAIRSDSPLSVALIDIDHFKAVNDTYGHLVGDAVLRAVTDAIQEHLRSYDLAGRFGGEEFVVLLPQARESDAINIAERLRKHVEAMSIPISLGDDDKAAESGERVRLTISVGVAALNSHTHSLTDLMSTADAAMYVAKETGRNKTHAMQAQGPGTRDAEAGGGLAAEEPGGASLAADVPAVPGSRRSLRLAGHQVVKNGSQAAELG
jgi:diguanylate cyclase (GGDEF)-like protein